MKAKLVKSVDGVTYELLSLPTECPHCHNKITPNALSARVLKNKLSVFFECPDYDNCRETFIGYYNHNYSNQFQYSGYTSTGSILGRTFSDSITNLSNSFVMIYNQSFAAEQQGLFEICGVGYRKSLEFLIKDYAINKYPDQIEQIEKKMLAQCIGDYISDDRIKSVSKRAVWLGNDETHYVRKWIGKNLIDLKKLIDLTLHWVEAEILTESFENEMPG